MKTLSLEQIKSAAALTSSPRKTDSTGENDTRNPEPTQGEPVPYDGPPWPAELKPEAFHGLAGDIVRCILPHTEADPAALLVQTLITFGNVVGRSAHWYAEATPHYTNEFTVIVGESAIARKGTSLDRIMALYEEAEPDWLKNNVSNGLVSGEGLIHAIRDPRKDAEDKIEDHGVKDKRLLVCEGEFNQVLSALARKDNSLSTVLRNSWDSKTLRTLARNSGKGGDVATNPHVSIIGHITLDELKAKMTANDKSNGFANRFLWVLSRRSKLLAFGGNVPAEECKHLMQRLSEAIRNAAICGEIGFTPEAAIQWEREYPDLNRAIPGLLGSATSRAPAHVRRLAVVYALLDKVDAVDTFHLHAALAIWRYCLASAEYIFGGLNLIALELHEHLHHAFPHDLDLTELHRLTGRHIRGDDLRKALEELRRCGCATSRNEPTNGAPREMWQAIAK